MKNFIISIAVLVSGLFGYINPEKISGKIEQDTSWEGRVILEGDVYVAPGAVLTVLPGTKIEYSKKKIKNSIQQLRSASGGTYDIFLEDRIELIIAGDLVVKGTSGEPVTFTADRKRAGAAGGICFIGNKSSSSISGMDISGAYIGVRLYDDRSPHFDDVDIEDCEVSGVGCWNRAAPRMVNSSFVHNKYGIGVSDMAALLVEHCTVKNNSASGMFFEGVSGGEIKNCDINGNNVGVATGDEAGCRIMTSTISANGSGVGAWNKSSPRVVDCTFTANIVGFIGMDGSRGDVNANVFRRNGGGMTLSDSSKSSIRGNIFVLNGPGIVISGHAAPDISDNFFEGNNYAIRAERVSRPVISSNSFRENRVAIILEDYTKPRMSGNTFSRNSTDMLDNRLGGGR